MNKAKEAFIFLIFIISLAILCVSCGNPKTCYFDVYQNGKKLPVQRIMHNMAECTSDTDDSTYYHFVKDEPCEVE